MPETVALDFENVLDAFETVATTKANQKDRISQSSANSYCRNIRYFVEWLANERGKGPLDAETSDLRVYLRKRKSGAVDGGDGDKDKTIVSRRSAISRFYSELPGLAEDDLIEIESDDCPDNPEDGYNATWTVDESYKEQQSGEEIQYLEPGEVKELWQNVPTTGNGGTLRNRLIIRLLYQTGMRVSEMINVRKEQDLDRDNRIIAVPSATSKSSNGRKVAYKATLKDDLRLWLDGGYRDAVPYADESDYLFPTVESEKIARSTVGRIVRKAAESANLNHDIYTDKKGNTRTKVSVHILRHSMAVNTLKAGSMNVRELQKFLGHSELETTEMYLKIASEGAVDAYKEKNGPPEGG